ncbi:MAG: 2-C-methyl-D-erythritol 4-phosphate cytidylyltransferase [Thermoleophilia bacterium]|nr:2-C-methyl-D-erythritol 4-phosphate cytidylyltransferase [Thermoleophilia bacterium]
MPATSGTVWAVLAAGGEGGRLGLDRPKAFAPLGARVLLAESLERLEESDWIDGIVVVVPDGWEEPAILLAEELGSGKMVAAVAGGLTRTASVRAGIAEVPADARVVLVHDAARPLVSSGVVERVLTGLNEGWDGVVPALPLADTVKRIRGAAVVETLERENLRATQTPQAFLATALREALASGEEGSDCATLVERRGGRVGVVEGERRLLKVTDAEDLAVVATWLGVAPAVPIGEDELELEEDDD